MLEGHFLVAFYVVIIIFDSFVSVLALKSGCLNE